MSCLDVKKTMKLKELKELTQAKLLKIYGIEESRSIFHLLLNEFLGIDVINFHINGDKKISLDSLNLFNKKISLIEKEIPVQYVIGDVIIEGLKIFVNKSVLIPRPETVDLCNWIIQKKLNDQVILDIGTGSGLIALFLKKNSSRIKIFWAKDKMKWDLNKFKKLIKNKKVYLTFDVDGLDSSIMPATGTPEPGGLLWDETLNIIKIAAKNSQIVGADINELSPIKGFNSYNFLVAKLAYKILSYKFLY